MKISIITVFPEFYEQFLKTSLIGRALEKNLIAVQVLQFSSFVQPKQRIDEPTVGPGAGMIIKPEVISAAIDHATQTFGPGFTVFFSPQGIKLSQRIIKKLAQELEITPQSDAQNNQAAEAIKNKPDHLILVCPRYEGIDPRVENYYADLVVSIGDFVLMGGDLPAQIFIESLLRYVPHVVGDDRSVENDSFSHALFDYPEYGLPVEWNNQTIPEILRSGNHAAINQWRQEQALTKTVLHRFDWFASAQPDLQLQTKALTLIPPHYVVLMHDQIKQVDGRIGTTSVTSIDLHDTARSCATYGVKNFFVVTPLIDQQKVIDTFLNFWRSDEGKEYNYSRFRAVSKLIMKYSLDDVIQDVQEQTGKKPIIISTCAKKHTHAQKIDYKSQGLVWQHQRPVIFLFGTGNGLADEVIQKADYLLAPIAGMTDFNHLSVRSAMAIILDRWLGMQPEIVQNIVKNVK